MNLLTLRFLLICELAVLSVAWICNDERCDPTGGVERCFYPFDDQYVKFYNLRETFFVKRRLLCDVMCFRRRCTCYIYLPDSSCILAFRDVPPSNVSFLVGTNVAREKPVTVSSTFLLDYPTFAVDGNTKNGHYVSERGDPKRFFHVDLETPQLIRAIKIITRQDSMHTKRFMNIEIYVSNEADFNRGVETGILVSTIPTTANYAAEWWYTRLENIQGSYRYVIVVRREGPSDFYEFLEIAEIEIMI